MKDWVYFHPQFSLTMCCMYGPTHSDSHVSREAEWRINVAWTKLNSSLLNLQNPFEGDYYMVLLVQSGEEHC